MGSKLATLVPTVRSFNYLGHEGLYYSLMMSTGLTFGTISALFGLNNGVIDRAQYSHLVATVIASAVVPTAIANAYFLPRHLLPKPVRCLLYDLLAREPSAKCEVILARALTARGKTHCIAVTAR